VGADIRAPACNPPTHLTVHARAGTLMNIHSNIRTETSRVARAHRFSIIPRYLYTASFNIQAFCEVSYIQISYMKKYRLAKYISNQSSERKIRLDLNHRNKGFGHIAD
jgi:hypothetical protein